MPVDTSASYYQWFMTDDPTQRIIGFEWHPVAGGIISSMTMGEVTFNRREAPGDTWGPPKSLGEVPWVVAQTLARNQGFNVEIAVKS